MRLFAIALLFISQVSWAGIMELSGSYGVRSARIDDENYTRSESWTGSFAWYFFELSAVELSYTNGRAVQSSKAEGEQQVRYVQLFEMYGADLVLSFAGRESVIQPFVRGGLAHLKKRSYRESGGERTRFGETIEKNVPTYGGGLKFNVTKTLSIRGSYDRWKSGSNTDKNNWDDAVKAGISWYF